MVTSNSSLTLGLVRKMRVAICQPGAAEFYELFVDERVRGRRHDIHIADLKYIFFKNQFVNRFIDGAMNKYLIAVGFNQNGFQQVEVQRLHTGSGTAFHLWHAFEDSSAEWLREPCINSTTDFGKLSSSARPCPVWTVCSAP